MRESIIFSSGMLEVLVYILIIVEPDAAIPREYKQILSPGDIIQGWHRARENHYKFERRLIIGHDHPYDRYSSMKIFWPEERSPYATTSRITFFKCINRTPSTAKALMHVIRGGTGSPEVVVDVRYAPVRFMLINLMVITCHICTEESDIGTKEEQLFWSQFHVRTTNKQIEPVTVQTKLIISALETTAENPTSSIETTYSEETTFPRFYNEETSAESDSITMQIEKTDPETDLENLLLRGMGRKRNKTISYTNGSSHKTSWEDSQGTETKWITSNAEKNSLRTGNVTSEVTGPKSLETSFHKSVKCPKQGKITLHIQDEISGKEEIIEIICGEMNPATSETSFQTIGTSPTTLTEISTDEIISTITSSSAITTPSTEWTTLETVSTETVETAPQTSTTSSTIEKASSSMPVQSVQIEKAIQFQCGNETLKMDEASYDTIRTPVKTSNEDLQDQEDANSKTERPIEKVTKPLTYNLILKIVPISSKKKIGLAKITY